MSDRFDTFIERVLSHEGGYVNNSADPGGETKWGISKRSYPALNIKTLTRAQAVEIYRRDFWQLSGADKLPPAVGFQVFDAAVNSGVRQAVKWLQQAVDVPADGVIGPVTLAAAAKHEPAGLVMSYLAERLQFMTELGTWGSFGRGWARRIVANLHYGEADT